MNYRGAAAITVAVLLTACAATRTAPIRNVTEAPVVAVSGQTLTAADVERAIRRAGAQLGWTMRNVRPGLMEATLVLRAHSATVEIPYSQKSYSIQYKTSTNLQADDNLIHQNYNGWVENLDRGIRVQLVN